MKFKKIILDNPNNLVYIDEILKLYKKYSKFICDDYFSSDANFLESLLRLIKETSPYFWIILEKESNEFAGFVFLENFIGNTEKLHSAEITTCFKQKFWGNFTKKAARKFIKYCFKIINLKKLKAIIFKENVRVKMLLKSAGFKKEAILKGETFKNGKLQDIEIYSTIKKEVRNEHNTKK